MAGVGPLAECGLDEALGFAVGAGGVRPSKAVTRRGLDKSFAQIEVSYAPSGLGFSLHSAQCLFENREGRAHPHLFVMRRVEPTQLGGIYGLERPSKAASLAWTLLRTSVGALSKYLM